jgi:hypothetical protein
LGRRGSSVKDHCGSSPSSRLVPNQNQPQRDPFQYFNRLSGGLSF